MPGWRPCGKVFFHKLEQFLERYLTNEAAEKAKRAGKSGEGTTIIEEGPDRCRALSPYSTNDQKAPVFF